MGIAVTVRSAICSPDRYPPADLTCADGVAKSRLILIRNRRARADYDLPGK
jgi:hypothetical protein